MTMDPIGRLARFWRRVSEKRHRSQTTSYAKAANEMAGRNLTRALRTREKREEAEIIAACLEAGFPLASDEVSERLREAVAKIERDRGASG